MRDGTDCASLTKGEPLMFLNGPDVLLIGVASFVQPGMHVAARLGSISRDLDGAMDGVDGE